MIRRTINDLLGLLGYRMVRKEPSIARDVSLGRFDWLRMRRIKTVLDVGANTGQFASVVRIIFPDAYIHAFEPLSSCQARLQVASAKLQPMRCHQYALGDVNGEIVIHHNTASPSSSMLPLGQRHKEAFPSARSTVEEKVQVRTLDSIVEELRLHQRILMKIDVQGFEMNVLRGASETLSSIDTLIVETSFVSLYDGQPLFDDIYRFLIGQGFAYHGSIEKIIDPSNGEILQEDSVFFNTRKDRIE